MKMSSLTEWIMRLPLWVATIRGCSLREGLIATVSGWIQSSLEAWRWFFKLLVVMVLLHFLSQTWFALPARNPSEIVTSWQTVRRLVLAKVGLTSFMAAASLHIQIRGLIGVEGILPFPQRAADRIRRHPPSQVLLSWEIFYRQPLRWIATCANVLESRWWAYGWDGSLGGADDSKVTDLCWIGEVSFGGIFLLSLLEGCWGCSLTGILADLILGLLRTAMLVAGTFSYRVLRSSAGVFTGLQWDCLVVEECLLSIPLALPLLPNCWLPALLLPVQLLLFKCMFGSGVVKRRSRCPRWANSTAMDLHYETQPIPHVASWYMHKLPHSWHAYECWIAFLIQLPLTFFQWCAWPCRLFAFLGYASLMVMIQSTGNYGFFNVQVGGLAVSFLDDSLLPFSLYPQCEALPTWLTLALLPVVASFGLYVSVACSFSLLQLPRLGGIANPASGSTAEWALSMCQKAHESLHPLGIGHSYGPFAGMTTFRWELIFELSHDCVTWTQLEFPYKPGDINARPRWMPIGHFQRLDWRLWFVPLSMGRGRWAPPDWVESFVEKLLKGSPNVAALTMSRDDIVKSPPAFVRVSVWDYHFSSCDATPHQCPQVHVTRDEHASAYTSSSWWKPPCLNKPADSPCLGCNETFANNGQVQCHPRQEDAPMEWGSWWYRRFVSRCGVYYLHDGQLRTWTEAMCAERPRKYDESLRMRETQGVKKRLLSPAQGPALLNALQKTAHELEKPISGTADDTGSRQRVSGRNILN